MQILMKTVLSNPSEMGHLVAITLRMYITPLAVDFFLLESSIVYTYVATADESELSETVLHGPVCRSIILV